MKVTRILMTLFTVATVTHARLMAQEVKNKSDRAYYSVEIDPATFVFRGYSAHLRIQPKNMDHLLIGAGIYAMAMPSPLVNLNEKNKDKGWEVRLNQGIGIFTEYHFLEVNTKWFVGGQFSLQQYKIEQENTEGNSKFSNALAMGYGGYTLSPFEFPLYFKFWGGMGYTRKVSGENSLNGVEYDISPLTLFATVHVGYTF